MEMIPGTIGGRVVQCILLGGAIGLGADVVYPLQKKAAMLAQMLWSTWILWVWLVICFGVCRGDIRLGYWAAAALGAALWRGTASRLIRPVFLRIGRKIRTIIGLPVKLSKFILKKINFFKKNSFQREENGLQ